MSPEEKRASALRNSIEDRILECCALFDEVTTSDLQGMVSVITMEIISQCREYHTQEATCP